MKVKCDSVNCKNFRADGDKYWCPQCRMEWRLLCMQKGISNDRNILDKDLELLKQAFDIRSV